MCMSIAAAPARGDRLRHLGVEAKSRDVVDDVRARFERAARDRGPPRVDRDRRRESCGGSASMTGTTRADLLFRGRPRPRGRTSTGPRRFAADVHDRRRPPRRARRRAIDRAVAIEVEPAVREGVRRDVDDSDDEGLRSDAERSAARRAATEGRAAAARLEGGGGAVPEDRRQRLQRLGAPGAGDHEGRRGGSVEAHHVHGKIGRREGGGPEPVPGRDLAQDERVASRNDEVRRHARSLAERPGGRATPRNKRGGRSGRLSIPDSDSRFSTDRLRPARAEALPRRRTPRGLPAASRSAASADPDLRSFEMSMPVSSARIWRTSSPSRTSFSRSVRARRCIDFSLSEMIFFARS